MPITVAGTQITFNDGTNQTTAFTGSGGVTSLNGQTGAITNTDFNAIGSYSAGSRFNGQQQTTSVGTTIAGSSIISLNSGESWGAFNAIQSPQAGQSNLGRSGTWRAMNSTRNGAQNCCGHYFSSPNLWVRIS